jgi:thioredoxin reductase
VVAVTISETISEQTTNGTEIHDMVVVGGGPAGLSAATVLARARRSVLVVDAGEPRNAPAEGVHGYLSRDGVSPGELAGAGRAELARYGGRLIDGTVVSATRTAGGFGVALAGGAVVRGRRLLIATGLVDEVPDVPGLGERWGRDVLHCPYCHGWEVRDRPLGVLATGPMAIHQALLLGQWSHDVTLFRHTGPEPTDSEWEQLVARRVSVVDGEVVGLEVTDDRLTGVRLAGGRVVPRQALVVAPRFVARPEPATSLGLGIIEHPAGVGSRVAADPETLLAGPGVWVAGNVTNLMAQVVQAAAEGARAAIAINLDLLAEDVGHAVAARRGPLTPAAAPPAAFSPAAFSPAAESENCERVLGERRHGVRP